MADIFISYKKERRAHAERLAVIFEAHGYDVWWDYRLVAGEKFRRTIEAEIDAASAVVVLWCKASIESHFVIDEAQHAQKWKKLIQAAIETVEPPMGFRSVDHRLSLNGWRGNVDHESIDQLLVSVTALIGRPPRKPSNLLKALSSNLGPLPIVGPIEDSDAQEIAGQTKEGRSRKPAIKPAPTSEEERALDHTFFRSCDSADEFEAYLKKYPDGHFAELARSKMSKLDQEWVSNLRLDESDWNSLDVAKLLAKVGKHASRAELAPRARRGVPEAQTLLGLSAHDAGNDEEAVRLLSSAADQGFTRAKAALAFHAFEGRGMTKNIDLAIKLWEGAAESGNAIAQSNLAMCYEQGTGVKRNPKTAFTWFEKSASNGYVVAQYAVAQAFSYGDGTKQDIVSAASWYRKAAEQGHAWAQYELAALLYSDAIPAHSDTEFVYWLRQAADQGNAFAALDLGHHLESGDRIKKDEASAIEYFRKASDAGIGEAQLRLATMLEEGRGTARRPAEALRLYQALSATRPEAKEHALRLAKLLKDRSTKKKASKSSKRE